MAVATKTFLARVEVTLKLTVNDPQGNTVKGALASLGFDGVSAVRVGKHMEIRLTAEGAAEAERRVEEMCRQLLANPVIEQYRFTIESAEG
ncbi:MAG: phosphoribosylformylglycinamidine synthase subunit PurS [Dehalococcoidia bacterium]|nr:phosphoribosylformylglycinamidine synthase subunit PurS [Dehalococcoidia bacterium]